MTGGAHRVTSVPEVLLVGYSNSACCTKRIRTTHQPSLRTRSIRHTYLFPDPVFEWNRTHALLNESKPVFANGISEDDFELP